MSMLSDQAKQLRDTADRLDRIANVSTPWIHAKLVPMLREAADTIIRLRDRLQAVQGINGESNYDKLFGTPERAARTMANVCRFTHGGELCDRCQCYLFDSCDRTLRLGSEQKIYDALLEWLREDCVHND